MQGVTQAQVVGTIQLRGHALAGAVFLTGHSPAKIHPSQRTYMHWFPFYSSDFIGATVGLSCLERSLYALMLPLYYEVGPFPPEPVRTYRIIGCESDEQKRAVDFLLANFFILREDGWYQERAEKEKAIAAQMHDSAVDRGKRSAIARKEKYGSSAPVLRKAFESVSKASRNAYEPSTTTTTTTATSTTTATKSRGTRFVPEAPPDTWITFCQQERPDLNPATTYAKFSDHWTAKAGKDGVKLDWFATWRNWVRGEKSIASNVGKLTPAGVQAVSVAKSWLKSKESQNG